jgi:hypothetical protein
MGGINEELVGVFETPDLAWEALAKDSNFRLAKPHPTQNKKVFDFDGELRYYWFLEKIELNTPRIEL